MIFWGLLWIFQSDDVCDTLRNSFVKLLSFLQTVFLFDKDEWTIGLQLKMNQVLSQGICLCSII